MSRPRLTAFFPAAIRVAVTLLALAGLAASAAAQGFLVDPHPGPHWRLPRPIVVPEPSPASYRIASLEVNAQLRGSIAEVQVTQVFENTGPGQIEATFVFPLPYDGAIDELTLLVDGKEYAAKLLSKDCLLYTSPSPRD